MFTASNPHHQRQRGEDLEIDDLFQGQPSDGLQIVAVRGNADHQCAGQQAER